MMFNSGVPDYRKNKDSIVLPPSRKHSPSQAGGLIKMARLTEVMRGWSWEENKLFEVALAVVDEQHPERWQAVAAMVGGDKSAEDVEKHYVILVEDLQVIESGKLDHEFGELQPGAQSVFWTDENYNLLAQLNLN